MVSVLLIVFLLQLAIHLVNKYGAQRVNELVNHHSCAEIQSQLIVPAIVMDYLHEAAHAPV